ncbi:MAG: ATP-binding protein [Beijerinckiaceae bacterium]
MTEAAAILDCIADPVLVVGPDDAVMAANAAARTMLPRVRQGDPFWFSLREPDVRAGVIEARRKGQATVAHVERGPVERRFQIGIRRTSDLAVVLHFMDRTEIWQTERMRSDFVANASHELRTPLASLLGFIETLEGPAKDDPEARAQFLAIMREQGRRMARLIDDLLSLSRVEMNQHITPRQHVPLVPLVREVTDRLKPQAAMRHVTVTFDIRSEPVVTGDRDELVRVVENLVENAIKYGRENGHVTITIGPSPLFDQGAPHADLAVADDGPGIAAVHLPRLTERFYRVDASHSRQQGGTGLGLALAKHIINRHRGRLTIASEPGKGSVFTVSLPLA